MDVVDIVIEDRTKALQKADLNTICIFDTTKDIEEQIVDSTAGLTGVAEGDSVYKVLSKILENTKQRVVLVGVDMSADEKKVAEELNKIKTGFLYIVSTTRTIAEMKEIASWAGANMRIYLGSTLPAETTENIGTLSDDANSDYFAIFSHPGDSDGNDTYFAAGTTGLCAPKPIGSYTWANKSPNGVAKNSFDPKKENDLLKKNVNILTETLGRYFVSDGRTTSGSYIDITEGKVWVYHKMKEEITLKILNSDKVDYEDSGITVLRGRVAKVCEAAVKQRIIQEGYEIEMPRFEDILENDIANRELPFIYVEAVVLGSIHKAKVKFALALTKKEEK